MSTYDASWLHFERGCDAQVRCLPSKTIFLELIPGLPRIPWIPADLPNRAPKPPLGTSLLRTPGVRMP